MLLLNAGLDAVPTDVNYPYCGRFYRNCLAAYFEHDLSEMPEVVASLQEEEHSSLLGDKGFEEMQQLLKKHKLKQC